MKVLIFLFILLLSAIPAMANTVVFEFSGFIDTINSNENNALGNVYLNQPFNGWFSYSSVPDQTSNPDYGVYVQDASISTTLGALALNYLDDQIYVTVANDYTDGEDRFWFGVDASNGDFSFTNYGIHLDDSTGMVYNTGVLPMSIDLADFDSTRFLLKGYALPDGDWFDVEGEITNITAVPEPATFLLLGLGWVVLRKKGL